MVISSYGTQPLLIEDYSVQILPCESDVCQMFVSMATEDTFAQPEYEMLPFGEETMSHNFEPEISPSIDNIFIPEIDIGNEMLPNEGVLYSEKIPDFEVAQHARLCPHDGLGHYENAEEVELIQLLLASGRIIGDGEYDQAARIVSKCKKMSCQFGSPTQKLAYYICGALEERIHRETLGMFFNDGKQVSGFAFNIDSDYDKNDLYSLIAYYIRVLPYTKLLQFTSVQAIIDAVGNERKIHVIDLGIRGGSHLTVLMEYLAHRALSSSSSHALERLRITAVGMNGEKLRKTGRRLHELAKSLAIPFSYNVVEITDIEEIKEGLFTVKSGEALAVYSLFILRSLLYDPVLLDNLLIVIKKLRPPVMVNVEVEAQHNSPSFVNRFSEVLFHYMAYFDLLDVSFTDRNNIKRVKHEELITASQIRNMIVYEGKERFVRHVRTNVCRCLFEQAAFKEVSFSFQAMYQARLLLEEYASREYYTLQPDGHAIIVKWKGTTLFSLTAWSGNR